MMPHRPDHTGKPIGKGCRSRRNPRFIAAISAPVGTWSTQSPLSGVLGALAITSGAGIGQLVYALPSFPADTAPGLIPTPSDHLTPKAAVAVFCSALWSGFSPPLTAPAGTRRSW